MYCKFVIPATAIRLMYGINSSKVYCKWWSSYQAFYLQGVLIVAKCIVNNFSPNIHFLGKKVLIVAKCIVNEFLFELLKFL